MKDWVKAILFVGGVFLALILFHVIWPSKMKMEPHANFISSVRDEDHKLLTVFGEKTVLNNQLKAEELKELNKNGELNKFPIVPILSYDELPENYIYFLTKVESKNFFGFGKDNVYGMSFSGVARLFKGKASGGSNIPQQLLKNAIHKKEGIGTIYLSRKYGEQLAAFQMVKSASPEEILMAYTNYSGNFWYERDFSGLILASYAIFNLAPHELNDLEMLLTVKTLKGASDLKALCNDRFANQAAIKENILSYFKLIAEDEVDKKKLKNMQPMELRFAKRNSLRKTTSFTNFLRANRGKSKERFATQYVSSITNENQEKLQSAVDLFTKYNRSRLSVKGFDLEASLIAIDIETGRIEATLGNRKNSGAMANFVDYGDGFQVGSVLKPLVFLELFENHDFDNNTRLFNGDLKEYKYNPGNTGKKLLNKEVFVGDVLKYSLNKGAVNYRVHAKPLKVARAVESKLAKLDISSNASSYSLGESYILGTKTMTPWEVAQAYQMLFNDGEAISLTPWKYIIDPHLQDTIFDGSSRKRRTLYTTKSATSIKSLLPLAFETGGTCHRLLPFLHKERQYYGKTGTTGKAKDGWTVLSDGQKLIVVWVGYVKNDNGVLTRKGAPAVPSTSGAGSAGILAGMAYSKLYK
jgi:membrane peptidoglycan carboxypeptidase